jgi:hypothetical protein
VETPTRRLLIPLTQNDKETECVTQTAEKSVIVRTFDEIFVLMNLTMKKLSCEM